MKIEEMRSAKQLCNFLSTQYFTVKPDSIEAGIGREVKHLMLEDPNAPPLVQFLAGLDIDGADLANTHHYWQQRDLIQEHQLRYRISSIENELVDWKGEKFYQPRHQDPLVVMPQDEAILKRQKSRIVDYFISFVSRHCLPLVQDRGEAEERDVSLEEFTQTASTFAIAELWSESIDEEVWWSFESRRLYCYQSDWSIKLCDSLEEDSRAAYFSAATRFVVNPEP